MKNLKNNISGIILCIFEIAVGIMLLVNPIAFNTGVIITAGIVLMVIGLISVIKYFCTEAAAAAAGQYLVKGLVALLVGVFCSFKSQWLIITFPAVTIIYGIVILVTGLCKIQLTCDMIRAKIRKWFLGLISALLSVICAVVILSNPFTTTTVLWMFTGIVLIVESIIDIISLIVNAGGKAKE